VQVLYHLFTSMCLAHNLARPAASTCPAGCLFSGASRPRPQRLGPDFALLTALSPYHLPRRGSLPRPTATRRRTKAMYDDATA
jgi:hypothetical protein